ncbi:MAG: glycosylase [Lentisphaeria bacterium]|nr:glycosylase [Lentisphaeria bacterium]
MLTPKWLDNAVVYEIYPQSFYDTNGDGIGDLQGIIAKLDYIKSLGCDAIWMNPCFESPFQDAGYDISDFYKVAPRYGTNEDLWELFDKAHAKGLKVILDLVAGHTSIEHPYFKESCKHEMNEYSNYYVWSNYWGATNPKYRYINGFAERHGNYMTNFFYCQPALNYGFSNPEYEWEHRPEHPDCVKVREMMLDVMKFYLNHGCDGFRVDMAMSLIKGENNYPDMQKLWGYYRDEVKKINPEAVLISEWGDPIAAINAGFDVDFIIQFGSPGYIALFRNEKKRFPCSVHAKDTPSFFDKNCSGNSKTMNDEFLKVIAGTCDRGLIAMPTGNHDCGRIRQFRSFDDVKNVFAFIFASPGVPFLYYGDEIGMDYVYDLPSKEGGYVRTGSRTPMQWSNERNGGFSSADEEKLYLPIDKANLAENNVADQENDANSLLNFTRKLIEIRKNNAALGNLGEYHEVFASESECPYVFLRSRDNQKVLCGFNPSPEKVEKTLPNNFNLKSESEYLLNHGCQVTVNDKEIHLIMQPNSYFWLKG